MASTEAWRKSSGAFLAANFDGNEIIVFSSLKEKENVVEYQILSAAVA